MDNKTKKLIFLKREIAIIEIGTDFYQRKIYQERIDDIANKFDERLVDMPKVCWKNGKWECWDGQHTVMSAKRKGYTHIECVVTEVKSIEEAARLFSIKNSRSFSKPLTAPEDFNARRIWKEPTVTGLERTMDRYGYQFGKSNSPSDINSHRVPEALYKKYGNDTMDNVFNVMSYVFPNDKDATKADFMEGLAYYIHKNKQTNIDVFKKRLKQSKYTANEIDLEANSSRMFKGKKAYEKVFGSIYGYDENKVVNL